MQQQEAVLTPLRILTSKFAVQAYITSILFASTAFVLLCFAIVAYSLFYWSYVPGIGFQRTVHFQFDPLPPECRGAQTTGALAECSSIAQPWGVVSLTPDFASVQRYDISVVLHMPRTPANTEAGNFMLDAKMFAPDEKGTSAIDTLKTGLLLDSTDKKLLAHSRRPSILQYYSKPVDLAQKVSQLHWYLLGWRQEAETLTIGMFEGVEFAKGWRNVPATLRLEVQNTQGPQMQIYDAKVVFRARFSGLRWLMYNHRVISACFFITSFWMTEVVFTAIAWLVLSYIIFSGEPPSYSIKNAEDENSTPVKDERRRDEFQMSDTERTFPTYGQQPPLKYESPEVKRESFESVAGESLGRSSLLTTAEADDEDEDADFVLDETRWPRSDSGLGTSMESSGGHSGVRRRRSGASN